MASDARNTLYDLLPAIIRERDSAARDGVEVHPLRDLLAVIQEQFDALHGDIEQLYDDWFIETSRDWVVPYLGDLVGYEQINPARAADDNPVRAHLRARVVAPRREVANTIRYRRRKGTLALLEDLAHDVAAWPARAVEFYRLLGWNQHLDHLRMDRGRTLDLRDMGTLARLGGPFEGTAHGVDVRQISARAPLPQGRYNIPSVGLFVWRLGSFPITRAPARQIDRESGNCYSFSALGNDAPLFGRAQAPRREMTVAGEHEIPAPISRRALHEDVAAWFGPQQSLFIEVARDDGDPGDGADPDAIEPTFSAIDAANVIVTSLHSRDPHDPDAWPELIWPAPGGAPNDGSAAVQVAVDPETGRLMFPPDADPPAHVRVSYHHGFSAPMGGGAYPRPVREPSSEIATTYVVGSGEQYRSIRAALRAWREDKDAAQHAIVEITDSRVYADPIAILLGSGESLQIRAAVGSRPVIRVPDTVVDQREAIFVSSRAAGDGQPHPNGQPEGGAVDGPGARGGGCLTLDGLLVEGRGLLVRGEIAELRIRHCTFVPGWSLDRLCRPRHGGEASLTIRSARTCVTIEHSILGPIEIGHDEVANRTTPLRISDSIIDATRADLPAIHRIRQGIAHATLEIRRTTVVGSVLVHAIELGEDSIFLGTVTVARRQVGCLRFCWVRADSRTPTRYHCQPDLAVADAHGLAPESIAPQFTSLRYGNPGYGQLSFATGREVAEGASDESEMGAFHDLFQPQRVANLRTRLAEYTPVAMDAGIIFVT